MLLDDTGTTHWLDSSANWRVAKTLPVVSRMPAAAPFPSLMPSRSRDHLYLNDVSANQIAVLNSQTTSIAQRLNLDFSPAAQAWLGIEAP